MEETPTLYTYTVFPYHVSLLLLVNSIKSSVVFHALYLCQQYKDYTDSYQNHDNTFIQPNALDNHSVSAVGIYDIHNANCKYCCRYNKKIVKR